jgi:hypothetical protein
MQLTSPDPHDKECRCECEPCRRKVCQCEANQCEACQREDECRCSVRVSLSSSLNTLLPTASPQILRDEGLSSYLYICLQSALTHDWDPDPYELRLLELGSLKNPNLGELESRFYHDGGGDKALLALYRETLYDKTFFTLFDALSQVAQKNLVYQTKSLLIDEALLSRVCELGKNPTCKISIHLTILYLTLP